VWVIQFKPGLAIKIQYLPLDAALATFVFAASALAAAFALRAAPLGV
jgi:hypothetical protein